MRLSKAQNLRGHALPLFTMRVPAGIPSPVDDSVEERLDLGPFLVKRPESTFFVRVEGESMVEASIHPGDLLVVDRSVQPRDNDIVIAIVEGEFTVKMFNCKPRLRLISCSRKSSVEINRFEVWGVVLWVVHKTR